MSNIADEAIKSSFGKVKKFIGVAIALVVVLLLVTSMITTVGPTERGILITMGKAEQGILAPGVHFKAPFFQAVKRFDMSPIEYEKSFSVGQDGALSKDQQTVGLTFTLYWQYNEARLYEVVTGYSDKQKIYQPVSTAIKAAIKNEVGKWSVEEIVNNQATVQAHIREAFLNAEDVQRLPITVTGFAIGNWDWSDDYDAMIKKTMARKQEVEQMRQEVALSEQAAQKQVKEAEAEKAAAEQQALAAEARAKGQAAAAVAQAEGEATAKKLAADAELYAAQQLAKAADMKIKEWKHEEEMLRLKNWNGKEVPDVLVYDALKGTTFKPGN